MGSLSETSKVSKGRDIATTKQVESLRAKGVSTLTAAFFVLANVNAVTGDFVAALVGRLNNGTVNTCYAEGGSVTGAVYVGGLAGDSFLWCSLLFFLGYSAQWAAGQCRWDAKDDASDAD